MSTETTSQAPPQVMRGTRRDLVRVAAGGAIAGAGLTRGSGMTTAQSATPVAAPSGDAGTPVQGGIAVFPAHGTVTASPGTTITFRGAIAETLGAVEVNGSVSGFHSGYLESHRDRGGASFIVDASFQPGESVTVTASVPVGFGPDGVLEFRVSTPTPSSLPRVNDPSAPVGGELRSFRTRPDLRIPKLEVLAHEDGTAPGLTVVAPRVANGPSSAMLVDDAGSTLWAYVPTIPNTQVLDLRVQEYEGRPVLSWWQGASPLGYGYGHFVIVDGSYEHVATVQAANDFYGADIHEFLLTPQGTALILIYQPIAWDLTAVGGPVDGAAHDSVIQEIDVATGHVWFEWHSLDHVAVEETNRTYEPEVPTIDYFHINSADRDAEGNYLCSARHTSAIYKVDGRTGEVIWRLNGSRSDFTMGEGTPFHVQHDARWYPDGSLSLFDNATEAQDSGIVSRGMVLDLDETAMTATLVREYLHPELVVSISQANMQRLPNGNVFIGWGSAPVYSEHAEDGTLVFDGRMPSGVNSYRAYRNPWVGRPVAPPDVLVERADDGTVTVYVSWNGATEAAQWEIHTGADAMSLSPVGRFRRDGFETTITGLAPAASFAARALDAIGTVLGTSLPVSAG